MKKRTKNNTNTLDSYHKKIVGNFNNNTKELRVLNKKLTKHQTEYSKIADKQDSECTVKEIKRKIFLKKAIKKIEKELQNIDNKKDESTYYLNTMDLLTTYYNKTEEVVTEESEKKSSILDFLNNKNKLVKNTLSGFVKKENKFNKKFLFTEYLSQIEDNPTHSKITYVKNYTFCDNCNTEKVLIQTEALYVCYSCGECNHTLIEADKPSYNEPIAEPTARMGK